MPYSFGINVSDAWVQTQPQLYTQNNAFEKLEQLNLGMWRMVIPYGLVCTNLQPGPYEGTSSSGDVITATITGSGYVGTSTSPPNTNGSLNVQAVAYGSGVVTSFAPGMRGRDWSLVDAAVNNIRLNVGCDILFMIGQDRPSYWTAAQFTEFCQEIAFRYGPNGPGIRTDGIYSSLAGWGVNKFEFWNEQNAMFFWTNVVSVTNYVSYLQAGYTGIKSILPGNESVCVFGGMQHVQFVGSWIGYGWDTVDEVTFFEECMAGGAGGYFDAVATHVYPITDTAYHGNVIEGMQLPAVCTSGNLVCNALATGHGVLNINKDGTQIIEAQITGSGQLEPYQPAGPVPNIFMDNFRQVQGIYAVMQEYGYGSTPMWITELGYCIYQAGMNELLQQAYTQQCFNILNTLPYVTEVFLYNAMDANNAHIYDGYTGYGLLDYQGNPRNIYYWLQTLLQYFDMGSLQVQAQITGTGTIASGGAPVINAAATGTGQLVVSGAIITAVATGTGVVNPAGNAAPVINANITGTGAVGIYGSSNPATAGGVIVNAQASGAGVVNVGNDGTQIVTATATGYGVLGSGAPNATVVTATIVGSGMLLLLGYEIGVVGDVAQGALTANATIIGAGYVTEGNSGALTATATITGTGHVGLYTGGVSTITATGSDQGSSTVGKVGAGSLSATSTATDSGSSVVGKVGAGSLTVTSTALGDGPQAYTDMGSFTATATITGGGIVGAVGSGSLTAVASVTQTEVANASDSGSLTVTATITGGGVVGLVGHGSLTVTATPANTYQGPMRCFWQGSGSTFSNGYFAAVHASYNIESWGNQAVATQTPLSDTCVITGIKVWCTNAPGGSTSWTVAINKNGTTQTATNTVISGSATSATWNGALSCSQGDLVKLVVNSSGSPASSGNTFWIIEYFTPYNATYGGNYFMLPHNAAGANTNYTQYMPIQGSASAPNATASVVQGLVPMSMTHVSMALVANASIGSANCHFGIMDVALGTQSWFMTVTSLASGASLVNTAVSPPTYAPGKLLVYREAWDSSAWAILNFCSSFIPGTIGQQPLMYSRNLTPSNSAAEFGPIYGQGAALGTTETASGIQTMMPACTIEDLYAVLTSAPGGTAQFAFGVRQNATTTNVLCSISGSATTGNSGGLTASINEGDLVDFLVNPTGSPTASALALSCVQVIPQNTVGV
jgi:hypothetical protein